MRVQCYIRRVTAVGFTHVGQVEGGEHGRGHAQLRQRVLHHQAVHQRAQHAHLVRLHGVHAAGCAMPAAPQVAGADHNAYLHPARNHGFDDLGHLHNLRVVKQQARFAQRLAGQFQHDPFVLHTHLPKIALL